MLYSAVARCRGSGKKGRCAQVRCVGADPALQPHDDFGIVREQVVLDEHGSTT